MGAHATKNPGLWPGRSRGSGIGGAVLKGQARIEAHGRGLARSDGDWDGDEAAAGGADDDLIFAGREFHSGGIAENVGERAISFLAQTIAGAVCLFRETPRGNQSRAHPTTCAPFRREGDSRLINFVEDFYPVKNRVCAAC
jgi:hypothetical protein